MPQNNTTGNLRGDIPTLTLQSKMILMVTGLLTLLILLIGSIFSGMISESLEAEIGEKAMLVSKTVASMPEIREQAEAGDPWGRIQELAEEVRQKTGASFIVVADRERRRYSHPIPELIGQISQSSDSTEVLEQGKSLISTRLGSTGVSIRGKTPLLGSDESVIGYVSVGYLVDEVRTLTRQAQRRIIPWVVVVVLFGVVGAAFLSQQFKKAIFGLEPQAIAALFQQRSAILESIREGIVACDGAGRITLINQQALKNSGLPPTAAVLGQPVDEVFPDAGIGRLLGTGQGRLDAEVLAGGEEMVFNITPLEPHGKGTGMVASFRRKDEIDALAQELSLVKQYADTLRAQAHEHSNKLHTISGLIQLESYQEALDLITHQQASFQDLIALLTRISPDQTLSALIIGKFDHAQELKVDFSLDPGSVRIKLPEHLDRHQLLTVLGNLLDNGFEAARANQSLAARVRLYLGETEAELQFVVEDSGTGVSPELGERIFEKGVSGKTGAGRGMGLFLAARAIAALGGGVEVERGDLGGARFRVRIPKPGGG